MGLRKEGGLPGKRIVCAGSQRILVRRVLQLKNARGFDAAFGQDRACPRFKINWELSS